MSPFIPIGKRIDGSFLSQLKLPLFRSISCLLCISLLLQTIKNFSYCNSSKKKFFSGILSLLVFQKKNTRISGFKRISLKVIFEIIESEYDTMNLHYILDFFSWNFVNRRKISRNEFQEDLNSLLIIFLVFWERVLWRGERLRKRGLFNTWRQTDQAR